MKTATEVYNHFHTLSLKQALTEPESRALERAIKQLAAIGEPKTTPWTVKEDDMLMSMRRRGVAYSTISAKLCRTKSSCAARHRRLTTINASQDRQERYAAVVERNESIVAGRLRVTLLARARLARAHG